MFVLLNNNTLNWIIYVYADIGYRFTFESKPKVVLLSALNLYLKTAIMFLSYCERGVGTTALDVWGSYCERAAGTTFVDSAVLWRESGRECTRGRTSPLSTAGALSKLSPNGGSGGHERERNMFAIGLFVFLLQNLHAGNIFIHVFLLASMLTPLVDVLGEASLLSVLPVRGSLCCVMIMMIMMSWLKSAFISLVLVHPLTAGASVPGPFAPVGSCFHPSVSLSLWPWWVMWRGSHTLGQVKEWWGVPDADGDHGYYEGHVTTEASWIRPFMSEVHENSTMVYQSRSWNHRFN